MVAIKQPVKVSSFQERFSQLFFESGKSITELGEELHVSNQTVSAWKTGTRIPRVPAVLSIADYFGVDYEIVWKTIKDKLPQFNDDIKTLIENLT